MLSTKLLGRTRKLRGQIVDMVDYDSNLIAVAAGVPDMERSSAILKRVDRYKGFAVREAS
jgi:hypothetical protein